MQTACARVSSQRLRVPLCWSGPPPAGRPAEAWLTVGSIRPHRPDLRIRQFGSATVRLIQAHRPDLRIRHRGSATVGLLVATKMSSREPLFLLHAGSVGFHEGEQRERGVNVRLGDVDLGRCVPPKRRGLCVQLVHDRQCPHRAHQLSPVLLRPSQDGRRTGAGRAGAPHPAFLQVTATFSGARPKVGVGGAAHHWLSQSSTRPCGTSRPTQPRSRPTHAALLIRLLNDAYPAAGSRWRHAAVSNPAGAICAVR